MKTHITRLFPLLVCTTGLSLMPAGQVTAQTFKNLHSFTAFGLGQFQTNYDGATPQASLVLSGNTLYGTATYGGSSGSGTVFSMNTEGTGFTNLHSFTSDSAYPYTNIDGANPSAGLVLSSNILYGTAEFAGRWDYGTVFAMNTDGTGFATLHSGLNGGSDGGILAGGLLLIGRTLYGTSETGGFSKGTVFAVNTDGTGFRHLFSFLDGGVPTAGLISSGNKMYGTATYSGTAGYGSVFAVNTNGTGFTNIYSFSFGNDGARPQASLVLLGNTLYGTAPYGGVSLAGTVFALNTDGTGFRILHSFTAASTNSLGINTNSDGANPLAGLLLSGNTLFGTASVGGTSGKGTVFALNTDGTDFRTLYNFTATSANYPYTNTDGANPVAGLILVGNALFGTASLGGSQGKGTVFSVSLPPPQPAIALSVTNVILTWPTNYLGIDYSDYVLQFTTNLASPVWTTNSAAMVVVNGQNTVTNPISAGQQFFRLSQ